MFIHMLRPQNILEIGTFTAYAAIWMAQALPPEGKLYTIDINEELEDMVRKYIEKAELATKIDYRIGNALKIIPTLNITFDLVFIDADKVNYKRYYDLVFEKVRTNGFIVADNVLWKGKVAEGNEEKKDKHTQAIIEFNAYVHNDPRVENVLLPIRDGLMVARKL
jgi:predicted O-methyltransferase YrrM